VNPERWKQVNDLFHAALELDASQRPAFLARATSHDAALRQEVESLLAAHSGAGDFLETPAYGVAPELLFDEPDTYPAGRMVGPYRIIELIGRGGMGVVYAAEDTRLGRQVALKALPPGYAADPARRERLRREARAAAALTHPSIATIHALDEIDGDLFIVSELVRGSTLREELKQGALPPALLRVTLLDIADALAAAHAQGIVHRDLKPENVMRGANGRVKVLDFGLARSAAAGDRPTITQLTQAGAAVGTPGYMSPEQLSGATVDARTDIFAFGVLATELSTGEHPFGPDSAAMLRRMTQLMDGGSLSHAGNWSLPYVERVVRRCLRPRPEDRYTDGGALATALRDAESEADSTPAPSGAGLWWWQFHQGAIAVLLAAMPGVAWYIRADLGPPWGARVFLAALVLATMSITTRMNLFFTSRVHPARLRQHRARVFPWVALSDAALAVIMIAAALRLDDRDAIAGLLITLGTIILASVVLIEPATTSSAGLAD
jgi:hypothetical protein